MVTCSLLDEVIFIVNDRSSTVKKDYVYIIYNIMYTYIIIYYDDDIYISPIGFIKH